MATDVTGPETLGLLVFATTVGGIVGYLAAAWLAAHEQGQREQMARDAERREQERREPMRRGDVDAQVDALIFLDERRARG